MAQANWTRKLDWSWTSLLCGFSGIIGMSVGLGLAAWNNLAAVAPIEAVAVSAISPAGDDVQLQSFFPNLDTLEETLEQVQIREIVRREAARQQQLDQTRDSLAFNGSTTEDIEAHVIRQLSAETTQQPSKTYSN